MPFPAPLLSALRLRCPRCGRGRLFSGWFRMHSRCGTCGLDFRREPGFYLGSIYLNYAATALSTGALFGVLVLALEWSPERALATCLAVAVILPLLLFRWARSCLLAIDSTVNAETPVSGSAAASDPNSTPTLSAAQLSSFRTNDAQAGCAMGIALTLILLFGLTMAAATLWFAIGTGDADDQGQLEPE